MPVTPPDSPFEQIVLTQAAIRCKQMLSEWFQQKAMAEKELDEASRARRLSDLDPDRGSTREKISKHLFRAFKEYHTSIFQYASCYNKRRENRVFNVSQLTSAQEDKLKEIFDVFVERCYDKRGNRKIADVEEAAEALQNLYENLKDASRSGVVPLRYMRFPAGYMMAQLGQSEKWKNLNNGQGIDFTRGDKPKADEGLSGRFRKAFVGRIDDIKERDFKTSPYIDHHESYVEIAGYRFPCLRFHGRTHLLTDTGYPVDLTQERAADLARRLKQGGRAKNCMIEFQPLQEVPNDDSTKHLYQLVNTHFQPAVDTERQKEWAAKACKSLEKLKAKLIKIKNTGRIDGRKVDGTAMLVSMDIDLLTGLSLKDKKKPDGSIEKSEVARLTAFINVHAAELRPDMPADLGSMSDFLSLFPNPAGTADLEGKIDKAFKKLRGIARREHNVAMMELIEAARPHVKMLAPRIMKAVDKHFINSDTDHPKKTAAELFKEAERSHHESDKRRHETPRFFMTIGGIAAGKSNAEAIADEECGKDNYVVAGLDHVRSMFDRQAINLATDNHNYDYKNVEQAGKLVRALVLERARMQGYHVLLDGSGLPYDGRYAPIVKAFKDNDHHYAHQYKINVLAFDRTLYVNNPEARAALARERKAPKDALLQQGIRTGRELRAVPLKIIATNYASVPDAILQASQDQNVDRFWLVDTNPKKLPDHVDIKPAQNEITPYILSFTAEITQEQLDHLDQLKGADLRKAIEAMQEKSDHAPKNKKVSRALQHPMFNPVQTDSEKWDFKVVNKMDNGRYRIEVITDSERYQGTLENGLFNREANGPEELFKLTRLMGFDVEGIFQDDSGRLKTRKEDIIVDEWPQIPFATSYSIAAQGEKCLRIPDDTFSFLPIVPNTMAAGTGRA